MNERYRTNLFSESNEIKFSLFKLLQPVATAQKEGYFPEYRGDARKGDLIIAAVQTSTSLCSTADISPMSRFFYEGERIEMMLFKYGQSELEYLKKKDKKLGISIDRIGMIEREVIPDLFTALINSIVSQQISSKAAATVWNRMHLRFGEIRPETISSVTVEEIQQCGLSTRKSTYIRGIGVAVMEKELNLSELSALSDDEVIRRLSSLHGVGRWTAEMLLIFSMDRPDVVSWDDLAIQRGMKVVYGLKELKREQFERYRKRYSPFGSVASLYLWAASTEYKKE